MKIGAILGFIGTAIYSLDYVDPSYSEVIPLALGTAFGTILGCLPPLAMFFAACVFVILVGRFFKENQLINSLKSKKN